MKISFKDKVLELDKDQELLKKLKDDTNSIYKLIGITGFFTRLFYWLFNINHYSQNYHTLQAYYSWRKYEENIKMFKDTDRRVIEEQGGFILEEQEEPTVWWCRAGVECIKPLLVLASCQPVINCLYSLWICSHNEEEISGSLKKTEISADTHFLVNFSVNFLLSQLDIDAEINSYFSKDELKKRYKKLILENHPDKGGEKEKFQKIIEIYKKLNEIIYPEEQEEDEVVTQFRAWANDLRKKIDESTEMSRRSTEMSRRSTEMSRRSSADTARVLKEHEEFMEETNKWFREMEEKHAAETKKFNEEMARKFKNSSYGGMFTLNSNAAAEDEPPRPRSPGMF